MSGQNEDVKNETDACGQGCACHGGSSGMAQRSKWLISGAVLLAACVVTATRISGAKEADPKAQGFALPVVAARAAAPVAAADSAGWEAPLKMMDELNVVATNTEAVFLVIPSEDAARTAAIQREVSMASAALLEKGTKIGKYILGKDAEDYTAVAQQIGAPSVLALVKGKGMSIVADKDVSKDALLKAFVGASRPRSGCCCAGGAGSCK